MEIIKLEIRQKVFIILFKKTHTPHRYVVLIFVIIMISGLISPISDFIIQNKNWFILILYLIVWLICAFVNYLIVWRKSNHPEVQMRILEIELTKAKMNYITVCNQFGLEYNFKKLERYQNEVEKIARYLNYC